MWQNFWWNSPTNDLERCAESTRTRAWSDAECVGNLPCEICRWNNRDPPAWFSIPSDDLVILSLARWVQIGLGRWCVSDRHHEDSPLQRVHGILIMKVIDMFVESLTLLQMVTMLINTKSARNSSLKQLGFDPRPPENPTEEIYLLLSLWSLLVLIWADFDRWPNWNGTEIWAARLPWSRLKFAEWL